MTRVWTSGIIPLQPRHLTCQVPGVVPDSYTAVFIMCASYMTLPMLVVQTTNNQQGF